MCFTWGQTIPPALWCWKWSLTRMRRNMRMLFGEVVACCGMFHGLAGKWQVKNRRFWPRMIGKPFSSWEMTSWSRSMTPWKAGRVVTCTVGVGKKPTPTKREGKPQPSNEIWDDFRFIRWTKICEKMWGIWNLKAPTRIPKDPIPQVVALQRWSWMRSSMRRRWRWPGPGPSWGLLCWLPGERTLLIMWPLETAGRHGVSAGYDTWQAVRQGGPVMLWEIGAWLSHGFDSVGHHTGAGCNMV